MERFGNLQRKYEQEDLLSEYEDTAFFPLLSSMPLELAERHIRVIQEKHLDDADAESYLRSILEQRKIARTESLISDEKILQECNDPVQEIFSHLESDVLESPDIGSGQTARVKRFELVTAHGKTTSLAVKYLITPTAKTLSASAEHDMLHEVERIQEIETLEKDVDLRHIKVPHPYFHHKNEKIQCYGMELVDGHNLQDVLDGMITAEMQESIQGSLRNISQESLITEMETFFSRMHTYCIHGDVKPRNIMIDRDGTLYVIDFGQSVLATDISENAMEQFNNLKEDEIRNVKTILRMLYRKLDIPS